MPIYDPSDLFDLLKQRVGEAQRTGVASEEQQAREARANAELDRQRQLGIIPGGPSLASSPAELAQYGIRMQPGSDVSPLPAPAAAAQISPPAQAAAVPPQAPVAPPTAPTLPAQVVNWPGHVEPAQAPPAQVPGRALPPAAGATTPLSATGASPLGGATPQQLMEDFNAYYQKMPKGTPAWWPRPGQGAIETRAPVWEINQAEQDFAQAHRDNALREYLALRNAELMQGTLSQRGTLSREDLANKLKQVELHNKGLLDVEKVRSLGEKNKYLDEIFLKEPDPALAHLKARALQEYRAENQDEKARLHGAGVPGRGAPAQQELTAYPALPQEKAQLQALLKPGNLPAVVESMTQNPRFQTPAFLPTLLRDMQAAQMGSPHNLRMEAVQNLLRAGGAQHIPYGQSKNIGGYNISTRNPGFLRPAMYDVTSPGGATYSIPNTLETALNPTRPGNEGQEQQRAAAYATLLRALEQLP